MDGDGDGELFKSRYSNSHGCSLRHETGISHCKGPPTYFHHNDPVYKPSKGTGSHTLEKTLLHGSSRIRRNIGLLSLEASGHHGHFLRDS